LGKAYPGNPSEAEVGDNPVLKLKDEFPLTKDRIWFNTAAEGACPSSTIAVIEEYMTYVLSSLRGEGVSPSNSNKWAEKRLNSKSLFAKIIGASEGEIAFVPNASVGANTAFGMVPLEKGDNVVTTDLCFPMGAVVVNKQRERGIEPRFIQSEGGTVDASAFENAVDDRTKVVYVDQAAWFNGFLYDLEAISEIAHDHGAYLIVDGTQSAGSIVWDAKRWGVDFLAASTYKWMMGGPYQLRAGFLFIDSQHIDALSAPYAGDQTLKRERSMYNIEDGFDLYDYEPREGIERLEVFPHSMNSYVAVENSLRVLLDHGLGRIEAHLKGIGTKLIDGLLEEGYELQTPVEEERRIYVNFKVPGFKEVGKKLADSGVYVSPRVGGLRLSPHFYNNMGEVDVFLEKLKRAT
jgi:selenocysteine lyase/cysteine desulfurase